MIPRCFILLVVLALFGAITVIRAAEEVEEVSDNNNEARLVGPATIVRTLFRSLFIRSAATCLKEAINKCRGESRNPERALKCAREFLKANQERCAVAG